MTAAVVFLVASLDTMHPDRRRSFVHQGDAANAREIIGDIVRNGKRTTT